MENQANTVFKVGDVVSLKLEPKFRGVIYHFWEKDYQGKFIGAAKSEYDALANKYLWVDISYLNEKYETCWVKVSILHLVWPE